ncbi:MAG TPA: Gfo/Idh/MocA family oxidoreductase [Tepidisphaeraceae bacterium]|nr:Gfo/Idh/MocA family oxidoreductase [Tepidisphaeraceae bacterium]
MGVIGVGNMGSMHADYLSKGAVPNAVLSAICDVDPARIERQRVKYGDSIKYFDSVDALLAAKAADAIIIATPHYDHPPIAIKGFAAGVHVMSEKPAGVYAKQVREMNAAAAKSDRVFGIMFNLRTIPAHQKVKEIIESGELGALRRCSYVITNWLRSQAYYDSGGWRGTWAGEGGGVMMNQAPHNQDLYQWFVGMPTQVRAFVNYAKYHKIEVEDDVTAYFKHPDGLTGVFVTTTGEAPGTNTFELAGDRGRLVLENNEKITFYRTRVPVQEFIDTTPSNFPVAETWRCEIPGGNREDTHRTVTENWVNAIRTGSKLLCPGEEGLRMVEICNAIYLSAWLDKTVDVPVDPELYYEQLKQRVAKSGFKKEPAKGGKEAVDLAGSFGGTKM